MASKTAIKNYLLFILEECLKFGTSQLHYGAKIFIKLLQRLNNIIITPQVALNILP